MMGEGSFFEGRLILLVAVAQFEILLAMANTINRHHITHYVTSQI